MWALGVPPSGSHAIRVARGKCVIEARHLRGLLFNSDLAFSSLVCSQAPKEARAPSDSKSQLRRVPLVAAPTYIRSHAANVGKRRGVSFVKFYTRSIREVARERPRGTSKG